MTRMTKRLVSGIQPTGTLHIGNYLGAIKQWVELQDKYDAFFFLADYHTLTSRPTPEVLKKNSLELIAMLIALGVNPKSSTLFLQSDIPEHTELGWILNSFATLGQLNRMTQFKEKSDQYGQNVGLFTYPVLQTADVALYGAEVVPVGDDQVQHLELAREIVRSFNHHIGRDILIEPKPLITKAARVMSLSDPAKKMSKSIAGSSIGLLDDAATIEKVLKRAVTDTDPSGEMSSGVKNLFLLLENFSEPEVFEHFSTQYKNGMIRYSELKEQLAEDITLFLKPVQKTFESLIKDEKTLRLVLTQGADKARTAARQTLKKVKSELGLISA